MAQAAITVFCKSIEVQITCHFLSMKLVLAHPTTVTAEFLICLMKIHFDNSARAIFHVALMLINKIF